MAAQRNILRARGRGALAFPARSPPLPVMGRSRRAAFVFLITSLTKQRGHLNQERSPTNYYSSKQTKRQTNPLTHG